ncbi:hypothetical protein BGX34_011685 [Mortierella sp. NVP85]|nr:hypothetical protein BGX34_011685 [Mortierella sp. NVP85]
MTAVRNIFWLVLATVSSIPRSASAECCYSVSSKRVSSDGNGVVYSVALTASSQFAVDSPGMAYFAQVTFPSDFAIASVPTKCFSISSRVVSCTSTGSRRWTANFARITSKNKSSTTPKLDKVVVNGEQCGLKSSCRELKPSPVTSGPSTTTNSTTTSVQVTATSLTPTSTCPGKACPPPPTNGGNGDNSPSSNETYSRLSTGAIVGLAVGLVLFILISIFFCSRRRRKERKSDPENQPRRRRSSSDRIDYEGDYRDEAMLEKGAGRRTSRRKNSVAFTEDPLRDGRSKFPYDASSIRTSSYGGSTIRSSRKGTSASGKHKVGSPSSTGGTRKLKSIPEDRRSEVSSFYDRSFYDTNYDPITVEHQPLRGPRESRASSRGSPSNKSWVTTIASRNSRLFRSPSSASSGLGRYSTQSRPSVQSDEPCCDQYHPPPPQQQQPRRPRRSQDGITMTRQATSIRPPPKSVHRPPSRGDGSYTSSSYPAHQYEESDVDYLDVGKRSTLDNFDFYDSGRSMKNYQPPRGDQASGVPRNSQYMNPGQAPFPPAPSLSPPQPPTPAAQKPPQPERRGYVTPIHIRPQHHVNFLKEELRARDQQPAPYGYM